MAVTVADVLAMPIVRRAHPLVVAGATSLDRAVRWVHTTELPDIAPLLRGGELLLTTGIALPGNEVALAAFADSLRESGAAGLAIELGRRWEAVPPPLVAACERLGLPLVALRREVRFATVAQDVGERILDEQLGRLREAHHVHEVFTELGVAEAGPQTILDVVASLVGGTVVLESQRHLVLDYRPGPRGVEAFLDDWERRSSEVHLSSRTQWDESNGWLVTQVGRAERGWGRLVIECSEAATERVVAVAERAAAALALHLLNDRQRDSQLRRLHHELLIGLLAGTHRDELRRRCELAGFPVARRRFVGLALRAHSQAAHDEVVAATLHAAVLAQAAGPGRHHRRRRARAALDAREGRRRSHGRRRRARRGPPARRRRRPRHPGRRARPGRPHPAARRSRSFAPCDAHPTSRACTGSQTSTSAGCSRCSGTTTGSWRSPTASCLGSVPPTPRTAVWSAPYEHCWTTRAARAPQQPASPSRGRSSTTASCGRRPPCGWTSTTRTCGPPCTWP